MSKLGRPAAIQGEHLQILKQMVSERGNATMAELCVEMHRRTGISISAVGLSNTLVRAGLRRVKPVLVSAIPATKAIRFGYAKQHRRMGDADSYASSLTDAEWTLVADLFELPAGSRGRPVKYERRSMVDACCYVLRTGCAWTMLPKSYPPWLAVHKSFSRWAQQDKFEQLQRRLREQWRQRLGRESSPSAAIIDSQSTRISPQGGISGFDAGKKVKGRKRHLVVDSLGLLLAVSVTAASVQDRDAASAAMASACTKHKSIGKLFADAAYAGQCAQLLEHELSIEVEIVRKPTAAGQWADPQLPLWPTTGGFVVLAKRWVVERTHAWLERCRRLVMHHDRSTKHAEAWVWLAQAGILMRRLTTTGNFV